MNISELPKEQKNRLLLDLCGVFDHYIDLYGWNEQPARLVCKWVLLDSDLSHEFETWLNRMTHKEVGNHVLHAPRWFFLIRDGYSEVLDYILELADRYHMLDKE